MHSRHQDTQLPIATITITESVVDVERCLKNGARYNYCTNYLAVFFHLFRRKKLSQLKLSANCSIQNIFIYQFLTQQILEKITENPTFILII